MKLLAEKLNSAIPVLALVISIVTAWLMVPPVSGPPMVAFFLFAVSISSLIYLVRKDKTWFDTMLYLGVLALAFFTIYRANGFMQFFDFVFIFFFGSLLVRPLLEEHGVFSIILSPLIVIANSFTSKNIFPYRFEIPVKKPEKNYFRELIPTLLVTLLILLITIPLLASANPFFNQLLQNTLKFFNLDWLTKFIFADRFEVYIFRFIFAVLFIYCIPRILTLSVEGIKSLPAKQFFSINYLYPKLAMAGLLIIFFITQLQLYFASNEALRSLGYTNSRLTNEVFFQVTIVAFIVFLLAYFDKSRAKWNTRLSYFLTIESYFLIAIAFKSVFDYSSQNGFTQKRLWGYTTMTWLAGVLVLFIYYYKNKTTHLRFVKQVVGYTLAIVLLVNVLSFDYLIYNVSKPTVAGQIDYAYMAELSPDAHHNKEMLEISMKEAEQTNFTDIAKTSVVYTVLGNIDYLKHKYKDRKEFNTFNIGEYQEYLDVKNIDTEAIRRNISPEQQKNNSHNQSNTTL